MSCPSSIRCRDSNPQTLECESPPITTRPGLQVCNLNHPKNYKFLKIKKENTYFELIRPQKKMVNVLSSIPVYMTDFSKRFRYTMRFNMTGLDAMAILDLSQLFEPVAGGFRGLVRRIHGGQDAQGEAGGGAGSAQQLGRS